MKCAYSGCTCRTIDGGFCSQMCAQDAGTGERREGCTCNHVGCQPAAVRSVSPNHPGSFEFRIPL